MHTFIEILFGSKENVFLVERTNGKTIVTGILFADYSLKNTPDKQYLFEIVDA